MEAITITPITVGHLRWDLSQMYQLPGEHALNGRVAEIPMQSFHIALPGRSVMVDAVDFDPREISSALTIRGYRPPPPLHEQLRARGIDAARVSDVIITHVHFDHIGALALGESAPYRPAFSAARHFVNTADWQPEDFDDLERRTLLTVQQHGRLELVTGEVDLGDGLAIVPLPGETAGHQMLRLQTEEGERYFAGDLFHHEVEFADPALDVYWSDLKAMRGSKAGLLRRAAANKGRAYFTHIAGPIRVGEAGVWEKVE